MHFQSVPQICPVCREGKNFNFIRDYRKKKYNFSLFECRLCEVQFWTPFKSPSAEWYKDLYQKTKEYELNQGLKANINRGYHKNFLKKYKDSINGAKILDLGCGRGEFIAELRKRGSDVWGIDFDKNAIEIAKKNFGLKNAYAMSFADFFGSQNICQFDFVTFFEVIEHIDNPLEFIQNVEKILKPGGKIVLSTPCRDRFLANLARWDFPPHHLVRWNRESISNLFEKIDFEISDINYQEQFKHLLAAFNEKFRLDLVEKTMRGTKSKPTIITKIVYFGARLKEYIIGTVPAAILWVVSKATGRNNGIMLIELKRRVNS